MIFPQDKCTRLFGSLYFPLLKIFMGIRKAPTQNIWEMRFLKVCKKKKTELLFLALFLKMLKVGGRCACIVPDGVLFCSSAEHKAIRKEIIENNYRSLHRCIRMVGNKEYHRYDKCKCSGSINLLPSCWTELSKAYIIMQE